MKFRYYTNHRSGKALETTAKLLSLRDSVHARFEDKKSFKAWQGMPSTEHCFFSAIEGVNPHLRVNKDNPAYQINGLVLDFDTQFSLAEAIQRVQEQGMPDFPISWMTSTFSGGVRAVLAFEHPVVILTPAYGKAFVESVLRKGKFKRILPGLDEKALLDLALYYELGKDWTLVKDSVVAAVTLTEVSYEAHKSMRSALVDDLTGVDLPWNVIREQINKQYPGRWTGPVENLARGPRFWELDSRDPSSAVLTPKGVIFHTGGGGFRDWISLFGEKVVQEYARDRTAEILNDCWFDGSVYYIPLKDASGVRRSWREMDRRSLMISHLEHQGLSCKISKGQPHSEVKETLLILENDRRVDRVEPHLFDKRSIIVGKSGKKALNSSDCWPFVPSEVHKPTEWGEGFPFIRTWLENMFLSEREHQLDIFLAWLHRLYRGAVDGKLEKGQALFIAGGTNTGKTLLGTKLLSEMMGGHSDAGNFMTGADQFNGNTFKFALITVDDEQMCQNENRRKKFSNIVKKLAANTGVESRAMYKDSVTIRWNGRVVVTLNEDPESLRMLPDISISMADKVIILQVQKSTEFSGDVEDVLEEELPAFCRFVYGYRIPENVRGHARWGVMDYIHPALKEEIHSIAYDSPIEDLVAQWRREYFTTYPDREVWKGSPTDLLRDMETLFEKGSIVLKDLNAMKLGHKLKKMMTGGCDWLERKIVRGSTQYRVSNPKSQK